MNENIITAYIPETLQKYFNNQTSCNFYIPDGFAKAHINFSHDYSTYTLSKNGSINNIKPKIKTHTKLYLNINIFNIISYILFPKNNQYNIFQPESNIQYNVRLKNNDNNLKSSLHITQNPENIRCGIYNMSRRSLHSNTEHIIDENQLCMHSIHSDMTDIFFSYIYLFLYIEQFNNPQVLYENTLTIEEFKELVTKPNNDIHHMLLFMIDLANARFQQALQDMQK